MPDEPSRTPPPAKRIAEAIEIYLRHAYGDARPASAVKLLPEDGFDAQTYLSGDKVERAAGLSDGCHACVYRIRLGNVVYPHMKLKIAYVTGQEEWVFSVDSHDGMLRTPSGSGDSAGLGKVKEFNARLVEEIEAGWDQVGILTQKGLLRRRIEHQKRRGD
jgi:hypothetical protein